MGCSGVNIQLGKNPFKEGHENYNNEMSCIEVALRDNDELRKDFNIVLKLKPDEMKSKLDSYYQKHSIVLAQYGFRTYKDFHNLVIDRQIINFILESDTVNFKHRYSVGFLQRIIQKCIQMNKPKQKIINDFLKTHTKDFPYEQIGPELNIDTIFENDIQFPGVIRNLIYNQRFQNFQFLKVKLTLNFCIDVDNFYEIGRLLDQQIYLLTVVIEICVEDSPGKPSLLNNLPIILNKIVGHRTIKNFVFLCKDALKCKLSDGTYDCLKKIMAKHNMLSIHLRNIPLNDEVLEGFINSHSRYVGLENSEPDKDLFVKLVVAIMKHTKIIFCLLTGFGIESSDVRVFEKKIESENSNVIFEYLERLNIDFDDLEKYIP